MRNRIYKLALMCVIVLQIIYTVYVFLDVKEGNFSDEIWSYGLSNSYYQSFHTYEPGIPSPEFKYDREKFRNNDEWISGKVLKNYLTVQRGQQFAYGSVYDNNAKDVHPPLYYMLMHTICSFFPDTFSWWFGFGLNLLFLVGTQIYLYMTAKIISHDDNKAIATCLLYAGSIGAVCTYTFVRQYTMLTMLCMGFVYYSACVYEALEEKRIRKKPIICAAILALLAFLTHYYGIYCIGIFTATFCFYAFCRKKWKLMFGYGGAMTVALILLFVLFPPAFTHIFRYSTSDKILYFSPAVQIRMLFSDLCRYNYGFTTGCFPTAFWSIVLPLIGAMVILAVVLLFPFRHEAWFGKMLIWLKKIGAEIKRMFMRMNYIPVFSMISTWALYELVSHTVNVYETLRYSMRYVSHSLPLIAMSFVLLVSGMLIEKLKVGKNVKNILLYALVVGIVIRVHVSAGYPYTFPIFGSEETLHDLTAGKNVLVIDGHLYNYITAMTSFTYDFCDTNLLCFTSLESIEECVNKAGFDDVRIDFFLVESALYSLSDVEKEKVYAWLPEGSNLESEVWWGKKDDTKRAEELSVKDRCMGYVRKLNEGAAYEIVGVKVGQKGVYYICKFS